MRGYTNIKVNWHHYAMLRDLLLNAEKAGKSVHPESKKVDIIDL